MSGVTVRGDAHRPQTDLLVAARAAHQRRDWHASHEAYARAGEVAPLGTDDLDALAFADYRELQDRLADASHALEDVNIWAAAEGFYQLGEVRRLLGDHDGALAAFAKTRELGMDPQPGEALLRCRQGDSQAAWAATALTRPKVIAVNWNPVPPPSTRRVWGLGRARAGGGAGAQG